MFVMSVLPGIFLPDESKRFSRKSKSTNWHVRYRHSLPRAVAHRRRLARLALKIWTRGQNLSTPCFITGLTSSVGKDISNVIPISATCSEQAIRLWAARSSFLLRRSGSPNSSPMKKLRHRQSCQRRYNPIVLAWRFISISGQSAFFRASPKSISACGAVNSSRNLLARSSHSARTALI